MRRFLLFFDDGNTDVLTYIDASASLSQLANVKKIVESEFETTFYEWVEALNNFTIPKSWLPLLERIDFSEYSDFKEYAEYYPDEDISIYAEDATKLVIEVFNYFLPNDAFLFVVEKDLDLLNVVSGL